jgi:hypothetical protein
MRGLKGVGAFLLGPLTVGLLSIMLGRFSVFEWIFVPDGGRIDARQRMASVFLACFAGAVTFSLWRLRYSDADSREFVRGKVLEGARTNLRQDLAPISGGRREILSTAAEKKMDSLNL